MLSVKFLWVSFLRLDPQNGSIPFDFPEKKREKQQPKGRAFQRKKHTLLVVLFASYELPSKVESFWRTPARDRSSLQFQKLYDSMSNVNTNQQWFQPWLQAGGAKWICNHLQYVMILFHI